jgi:hypothetical protein
VRNKSQNFHSEHHSAHHSVQSSTRSLHASLPRVAHSRATILDVSAHMGVRTFYSILAAINVGFLCFSIVTGHSKDDPLYDPKPPRKSSKLRKT